MKITNTLAVLTTAAFLLAPASGQENTAVPLNNECVNATVVPFTPLVFPEAYTNYVNNFKNATSNPLDPMLTCEFSGGGNSVWYTWTPSVSGPFDFASTLNADFRNYYLPLGIYTGGCGALAEVACGGGNYARGLRATVRAGVTYRIRAYTSTAQGFRYSSQAFSVAAVLAPPVNDECAAATVIPSAPVFPYRNVVGNFSAATVNSSDLSLSCSRTDRNAVTVWYTWTPSASGLYDFIPTDDVFYQSRPTYYLGIYKGKCGLRTFTEAACSDYTSTKLRFAVTAGKPYRIRVGSSTLPVYYSMTFIVKPAVAAPPNELCSKATVIPSGSVHLVDRLDTSNATKNSTLYCGNIENNQIIDGHTVWYKWTAPKAGKIVVSTVGSTTPTGEELSTAHTLSTGTCGSLVQIACSFIHSPDLTYVVAAGETYYVEVAQSRDNLFGGGYLVLTFDFESSYLQFIDADTKQLLGPLEETVYYRLLTASNLNIRASFDVARPVSSVGFTFSNPARTVCDGNKPYTVFGDSKGNYSGAAIPLGPHVVTATPYARSGCRGTPGKNISDAFQVEGCDLFFQLYNGINDVRLSALYDGNTVLSPPCGVNVEADVRCGFPIKRVVLELRRSSGALASAVVASRVELVKPYFLFGDDGAGDVYAGTMAAGNYSIAATINEIQHPAVAFTLGECS